MFSRKISPPPAAAPAKHSFRMKAMGTEFEAHGLGLIVAAFAVVLILIAVIVGSDAATQAVGGVFSRIDQATPGPLEKPPPQR